MAKRIKIKNPSDLAVNVVTDIHMIIAIAMLLVNVFWVYLKLHPEKAPETHITSYVSTIIDEKGEERQFIEVEYWENKDGRGKRILEFSFNAFSGQDCTAVRRMGVQYDMDKGEITAENGFNYTKDGGASWKSLKQEQIDVGSPMYLTIDNELFTVTMDGTYIEYAYNFNFSKGFVNFWKWAFANEKYKLNINDKSFGHTVTETVHPYTMENFYSDVLNAVIYNNVGYGTNILSLVDLSKFFTLKKFDGKDFVPVEKNQEFQNEYFAIKVTRHRDGLLRSKDSDFGMYLGDSEFTLVKTDSLINDFVGIDDNVILTYQDFDYKLCKEYGGYVAFIKDDVRNALSAGHINAVAINMDVSNAFFLDADYPVIGIMYDFANVLSVDLTFNQPSYPQFYEFYDAEVGRKFLPTDSVYTVHNRADEKFIITKFGEVEI